MWGPAILLQTEVSAWGCTYESEDLKKSRKHRNLHRVGICLKYDRYFHQCNLTYHSKNAEMLRSTSAMMRSVTTPVLTSLWLIDTKKRSTARPIRARSVARVSRPLSCSRATGRDTSQSRRCSATFVVNLSILKVRSIVSFNELSMIFPSLLMNLYQ